MLALMKKRLLTIYPTISKVQNIGFDGTGTHCHNSHSNYELLTSNREDFEYIDALPKWTIKRQCRKFGVSISRRIKEFVKKWVCFPTKE